MYKYSNSVKKQKNENIVFLEKEFSHEVDRMFYTKVNSMIMAFIYNIFIYIYIYIYIYILKFLRDKFLHSLFRLKNAVHRASVFFSVNF